MELDGKDGDGGDLMAAVGPLAGKQRPAPQAANTAGEEDEDELEEDGLSEHGPEAYSAADRRHSGPKRPRHHIGGY